MPFLGGLWPVWLDLLGLGCVVPDGWEKGEPRHELITLEVLHFTALEFSRGLLWVVFELTYFVAYKVVGELLFKLLHMTSLCSCPHSLHAIT